MGLFNLFGNQTSTVSVSEYLEKGAVVIDVRTIEEFNDGHVEGAKNIPLDTVSARIDEIKNIGKPVITCCRSGARSGNAAEILKQFDVDAINGGPWQNVANAMK